MGQTNNVRYHLQICALKDSNLTNEVRSKYELAEQIYVFKSGMMYRYCIGNYSTLIEAQKSSINLMKLYNMNSYVIKERNGIIIKNK